jgi:hypothetical protein
MGHHETRQKPQSAAHPSNAVALDTTEAGPPRLYAPGKPQEVESGPSRLQTQALGRHRVVGAGTIASTRASFAFGGAAEAGPSRIERFRK